MPVKINPVSKRKLTAGMRKVFVLLKQQPGLRSRDVADELYRTTNGEWTASRILEKLERNGFITGDHKVIEELPAESD